MLQRFRYRLVVLLSAAAVCLVLFQPTDAHAQLLYSFETGLEGWGASGFSNSDLISVATSTAGATEGVQSMVIETGPTFGWDVNTTVNTGDTTGVYGAFNTVAADLGQYTLDFDVTLTDDSFASVSDPGNYFLINVAVNSDSPNFPQKYNVTPNLQGLTGTFPVSIPMTDLPVAEDSSFYQLTIGSNSDHVNGTGGEGVLYHVDNIRFTELPQLVEETIFSWETPDDPGTPDINEQYEGWTEGFGTGHVHSLTSVGATDGSTALQIDRQSLTTSNFTWGSQFQVSSDTNPDPEIEEIDPEIQAMIDELVGKIENAQAVAFDVRFDDAFPNTPTYTKFGVHITDDQGSFFDGEGASFNGAPAIGTTGTVTIPISSLEDSTLGTLDVAGLADGTTYLRIGISTNTDGAGIYQIDNFRLISEVVTDSADFDEDGDVDIADLMIWQRGYGATGSGTLATGDANGDSNVDDLDLAVWHDQFGAGSGSLGAIAAVPEPAVWALALLGCPMLLRRWRVA